MLKKDWVNLLLVIIFSLVLLKDLSFEVSTPSSITPIQTNLESVSPYYLVIPKINLYQEFFPNNEPLNNLQTGIMTLFPTKKADVYLLASHSGNGAHSYFNRLEQLNIGDTFQIIHDKTLGYEIISKKYKIKDGKLAISSIDNIKIILLTCSKIKKDKQVYFEAILKN